MTHLTTTQVAARIGCNVRTVIKLANRHGIKPVAIYGRMKVWNAQDWEGVEVAGRKLTPIQVRAIRKSGDTAAQLAERFGVSRSTIEKVRVGARYGSVE